MLDARVERKKIDERPPHHVRAAEPGTRWTSYLPSWYPSPPEARTRRDGRWPLSRSSSRLSSREREEERTGFRNPWSSWHKPTQKEIWDSVEWGEDTDPCIKLAIDSLSDDRPSSKSSLVPQVQNTVSTAAYQQEANRLLHVVAPEFGFEPAKHSSKVTWLGHAGMLLQLPPLKEGNRPVRCIFDPVFSMRCSPSQLVGPARAYSAPCKVEDLPDIDVVLISHNHYDHLDYNTIIALWEVNKEWIRFIVPLGNKQWFVDSGIAEQQVTELDWWESVHLSVPDSPSLRIICTPAQHSSGRSGLDTDMSLWSSWYLEHPLPKPYRIFFAGDTGYQFHASPHWPPPPSSKEQVVDDLNNPAYPRFPTCPAFEEAVERFGFPHLLFLPIAVGATYSYLRSSVPLPDWISPFPRLKAGVTAANHMPPWDAVRILKLMTSKAKEQDQAPVAIAMHWGTFVTEPVEILKTLGQLQWACEYHDVHFARSLDGGQAQGQSTFLALNHGQSVEV